MTTPDAPPPADAPSSATRDRLESAALVAVGHVAVLVKVALR